MGESIFKLDIRAFSGNGTLWKSPMSVDDSSNWLVETSWLWIVGLWKNENQNHIDSVPPLIEICQQPLYLP